MIEKKGTVEGAERFGVIKEVVRTNAVITDDQFELLKTAVGKEVTIVYKTQVWSSDEDDPYDSINGKCFTLHDFNYVVDPQTGLKYLAFLKYGDQKDRYFPYFQKADMFLDIRIVSIEQIADPATGTTLWSFDQPDQTICFTSDSAEKHAKQIENHSTSCINSDRKEGR